MIYYKEKLKEHTEPWETAKCSATDQEREMPPFSLDPEFVQYREENREYN